jgi:hypothetical protein
MTLLPPHHRIRRYYVETLTLDPSKYPNRIAVIDLTPLRIDGFYIDPLRTTANLHNVEIAIEESDWIPASMLLAGVEARGFL